MGVEEQRRIAEQHGLVRQDDALLLGLQRGRRLGRQASRWGPRVLAVDDILLLDEREAIVAFDLLAHAGEDRLAGAAPLGAEIGHPPRPDRKSTRMTPGP